MNEPGDQSSNGGWAVVLHSTWTGIVVTVLGTIIFAAFAISLLAFNGPGIVTVGLLLLAIVGVVVVFFDMPVAASFDAEGVTRHTPLRRQRLLWSDLNGVDRMRSGIIRTRKQGRGGGLVAKAGQRSYALTDALESWIEFDEIRDRLGHERAEQLGFVDRIRPAIDRTPTWTYRRKKWRPTMGS